MQYELTLLLPYFNERGWLGRTIDSLVRQSDERFCVVLIDNGSTDGGESEARAHAEALGVRALFLRVPEPGKTAALSAAMGSIRTRFVSICDADTVYPEHYVSLILKLFAEDLEVVAVMAIDLYAEVDTAESQRRIRKILRKATCRPHLCHAGGYAQSFQTEALKSVGGFDPARWSYVLEDHEVVHRIMRKGTVRYAPAHYCYPSARRQDRRLVSWTVFERLVYRLTPRAGLDWYFYDFLAPRLMHRGGYSQRLREKNWVCPGSR